MKKNLLIYLALLIIPFTIKGQTPINAFLKESNFFPGSDPKGLLKSNGKIFFTANTGQGYEPHQYNVQTGVAEMIQDINGNFGNSMLKNEFFELNNKIYYFASDNSNVQLWSTDPATNTTSKVKDFNVSSSSSFPIIAKVLNNKMYIIYQQKLYVSDGTPNSTFQITNVDGVGKYIFESNGYVFFFGNSITYGRELWKTDGSVSGTVVVKDIVPGWGSGILPGYERMYSFNNKIIFLATASDHNNLSLWSTDGTPVNTNSFHLLINYSTTYFYDFDYENFSTLLFNSNGNLWTTDGTSSGTSVIYNNIPLINKLSYFKGKTYIDTNAGIYYSDQLNQVNILNNSFGSTLQMLAPSDDGNYLAFKEFNNNNDSKVYFFDGSGLHQTQIKYAADNNFIEHQNRLIISGYQESYYDSGTNHKNIELFSYNPSNGVSQKEKDLTSASSGTPLFFTELNGEVYYLSRDGAYYQVYKKDINNNIVKLSNNLQEYFPDNIMNYYPVLVSGNYIYFHSSNLIRTDGLSGSTQLISPPANEKIYGTYSLNGNQILIKTFNFSDNYMRIWKLNNNASNFSLILERPSIMPTGISNADTDFEVLNSQLFFKIRNNSTTEIWKSDGTIGNTFKITDIENPYAFNVFLGVLNSKVFFFDNQNFSYNNRKLFYIDEVTNQVNLVKDSYYEIYGKGFVKNNQLHFFSGTGNGYITALHATDGTLQNTNAVHQINSQGAYNVTKCGNLHYFVDYNRQKLFSTNGTPAGTLLVTTGGSYSNLNCKNNELYGLNSLQKIFKTNGTAGNYQELNFSVNNQILQQPNYSWILNLYADSDRLYFTVGQYSNHGNELYITDLMANLGTLEQDYSFKEKILLYPNPATTALHVRLNNSEKLINILIYDAAGKLISTSHDQTVSVQHIPSGVYFIHIVTNLKQYSSKFIKK